MNRKIIGAALLLFLCLASGCKPTENNYKAAYEAAQAKRQKDLEDKDILIPGGKLFSEDDPQPFKVHGIDLLARHEQLKLICGDEAQFHKYNVAIASFKMDANARSYWERLKDSYPDAVVVQNVRQIYFVCIGSYESEQGAALACEEFRKRNPDCPYVGIPQAQPVIEIKPR
ncbi:MAG: SPOR domain-containing protein [Bacteroidales bacterium]|nr:SPOR domain-containing protein [Bacteroidales bacterium]